MRTGYNMVRTGSNRVQTSFIGVRIGYSGVQTGYIGMQADYNGLGWSPLSWSLYFLSQAGSNDKYIINLWTMALI